MLHNLSLGGLDRVRKASLTRCLLVIPSQGPEAPDSFCLVPEHLR